MGQILSSLGGAGGSSGILSALGGAGQSAGGGSSSSQNQMVPVQWMQMLQNQQGSHNVGIQDPALQQPNNSGILSSPQQGPGLLSMLGQSSGNSTVASLMNDPGNYLSAYVRGLANPGGGMTTNALRARQGL